MSCQPPAKNKHTRQQGRRSRDTTISIPRCHVISLPYSIQFLLACSLLDDWLHVVVSEGRFVCLLLLPLLLLLGFVLEMRISLFCVGIIISSSSSAAAAAAATRYQAKVIQLRSVWTRRDGEVGAFLVHLPWALIAQCYCQGERRRSRRSGG